MNQEAEDDYNNMNQEAEDKVSDEDNIFEELGPEKPLHYSERYKFKNRRLQPENIKISKENSEDETDDDVMEQIKTKFGSINDWLDKKVEEWRVSEEESPYTEAKYTCHLCPIHGTHAKTVMIYPALLKYHLVRVHLTYKFRESLNPSITCPEEDCNKRFCYLRNLNMHMRVDHSSSDSDVYKCGECGKPFAYQHFLDRHMISHQELHEKTRDFACSLCGLGFTIDQNLAKHLEIAHKIVEAGISKLCRYCRETFRFTKDREAHIIEEHGKELDWLQNRIRKEERMMERVRETFLLNNCLDIKMDKTENVCSYCGLEYAARQSFMVHLKTRHGHTNQKSRTQREACRFCTEKFKSLITAEEHVLREHSMLLPWWTDKLRLIKEKVETVYNLKKQKPCSTGGSSVPESSPAGTTGSTISSRTPGKRAHENQSGEIHGAGPGPTSSKQRKQDKSLSIKSNIRQLEEEVPENGEKKKKMNEENSMDEPELSENMGKRKRKDVSNIEWTVQLEVDGEDFVVKEEPVDFEEPVEGTFTETVLESSKKRKKKEKRNKQKYLEKETEEEIESDLWANFGNVNEEVEEERTKKKKKKKKEKDEEDFKACSKKKSKEGKNKERLDSQISDKKIQEEIIHDGKISKNKKKSKEKNIDTNLEDSNLNVTKKMSSNEENEEEETKEVTQKKKKKRKERIFDETQEDLQAFAKKNKKKAEIMTEDFEMEPVVIEKKKKKKENNDYAVINSTPVEEYQEIWPTHEDDPGEDHNNEPEQIKTKKKKKKNAESMTEDFEMEPVVIEKKKKKKKETNDYTVINSTPVENIKREVRIITMNRNKKLRRRRRRIKIKRKFISFRKSEMKNMYLPIA